MTDTMDNPMNGLEMRAAGSQASRYLFSHKFIYIYCTQSHHLCHLNMSNDHHLLYPVAVYQRLEMCLKFLVNMADGKDSWLKI